LRQVEPALRELIAGAIQPEPIARRALESLLPPMNDVVNGEVGAIVGAFESMSVNVTPPPGVGIAVKLSVSDAVSADNYERLFRRAIDNAPPERRVAIELLVPQREGTTFGLSIDTARFDAILEALRP
ncbi:MAG TPA: hypothetical protein PKB10_04390, partial [Tepidisphaeraceae bacterium]|nr:hypothetical protein [Tepidisphaeraceae bacterium]